MLLNKEFEDKKDIKKIVVTGGPCAGKTTALTWITNTFTKLGYAVIIDHPQHRADGRNAGGIFRRAARAHRRNGRGQIHPGGRGDPAAGRPGPKRADPPWRRESPGGGRVRYIRLPAGEKAAERAGIGRGK